ncbi:unnamed protein product [Lampetra planeri]
MTDETGGGGSIGRQIEAPHRGSQGRAPVLAPRCRPQAPLCVEPIAGGLNRGWREPRALRCDNDEGVAASCWPAHATGGPSTTRRPLGRDEEAEARIPRPACPAQQPGGRKAAGLAAVRGAARRAGGPVGGCASERANGNAACLAGGWELWAHGEAALLAQQGLWSLLE